MCRYQSLFPCWLHQQLPWTRTSLVLFSAPSLFHPRTYLPHEQSYLRSTQHSFGQLYHRIYSTFFVLRLFAPSPRNKHNIILVRLHQPPRCARPPSSPPSPLRPHPTHKLSKSASRPARRRQRDVRRAPRVTSQSDTFPHRRWRSEPQL